MAADGVGVCVSRGRRRSQTMIWDRQSDEGQEPGTTDQTGDHRAGGQNREE